MESEREQWLPAQRNAIISQISAARKSEKENKKGSYEFHRTGKECLYRSGGLEHFFEYLKTLESNKVLDIGVGTGNASYSISKMPISAGLDFEVTALRNVPELVKNFPLKKIHITSVESLKGIPNGTLAGVIGVNSIGYSQYPELAIKRIDEVLAPGGALKATFAMFGKSKSNDKLDFKSPEKFIGYLIDLGYDVASTNSGFYSLSDPLKKDSTQGSSKTNSIVLAIKPGNPDSPSAKDLLNLDLNAIKVNVVGEKYGSPLFDIEDN